MTTIDAGPRSGRVERHEDQHRQEEGQRDPARDGAPGIRKAGRSSSPGCEPGKLHLAQDDHGPGADDAQRCDVQDDLEGLGGTSALRMTPRPATPAVRAMPP